jgi:hypothetical protein
VPALGQSFFHGFRHLQLAATKFIVRMRLAEHASGREELVKRGQRGRAHSVGMGEGSHGKRGLMIAGKSNWQPANQRVWRLNFLAAHF